MVRWKVRTYRSGVWDELPPRTIDAESREAAAELVCGVTMVAGPGPYGTYRAAVWNPDDIADVKYFYVKQARKRGIAWIVPGKDTTTSREMMPGLQAV